MTDAAILAEHETCCRSLPMALRHEAEHERWWASCARSAASHRGEASHRRDAARRDRAANRLENRARAIERRAVKAGRGDAAGFLRNHLPRELGGRK